MKKTIWGYNIQEVDETVGYLETQNIKLERQVKQLSAELDKAKKELEEKGTAADASLISEKDGLIAELRAKTEVAEAKSLELVSQNEALNKKISELTAEAAAKDPFENIGSICRQVYTDIHNSKQRAKESIEDFLSEFWEEWKRYEAQLTDLSDKLAAKQQKSRESFISYADYILKVYGDIEESNSAFENQFAEIVKSKSKIECSLNSIISELDKDVEFIGADQAEQDCTDEQIAESVSEKESEVSILAAIRQMNESKAEAEAEEKAEAAEDETVSDAPSAAASAPQLSMVGKDEINISRKVNIKNII